MNIPLFWSGIFCILIYIFRKKGMNYIPRTRMLSPRINSAVRIKSWNLAFILK